MDDNNRALPPAEDRAATASQPSPEPVSGIAGIPSANEPFAYGIGSDHWPGVGKVLEEMHELGVELGKLMGSGGDCNHWSGDLEVAMQNEISDVRAALQFLQTANWRSFAKPGVKRRMYQRYQWKLGLFSAWQAGLPEEEWPTPQQFGLPSREAQKCAASVDTHAKRGDAKQAPSERMGSAVPRADEADAQGLEQ